MGASEKDLLQADLIRIQYLQDFPGAVLPANHVRVALAEQEVTLNTRQEDPSGGAIDPRGLLDAGGTRIDPATEGTLSSLAGALNATETALTITEERAVEVTAGSNPLDTKNDDLTPEHRDARSGYASSANTDILSSDLSPNTPPATFRVSVQLASSAVFSVMFGSTAMDLNEGTALTAGALYTFDIPVNSNDGAVNFQENTGVTVDRITVDEFPSGAP